MNTWKAVGIILAVLLALAGIAAIFRRRAGYTNARDENLSQSGCVSVPSRFERWSGTYAGTDWGGYGKAIKEELNRNPETNERDAVDNFFKAIDVEPKSGYVRYFADQIRNFSNSPNANVPHWQTEAGYLRCN